MVDFCAYCIDEEAWTEIGSNANWWGRPKKEVTCRSRANAKGSRIDGFPVNKEASPLGHDFYVEQDEMIPAHACVGIVLSRNASTEPRRFARTLPCLKKLFDIKLQELMGRQNFGNEAHDNPKKAPGEVVDKAAGKDKKKEEQEEKSDLKQQAAMKKEERKKLQDHMDREINGRLHTLEAYRQMQYVDGMWKMISMLVKREHGSPI